MSRDDVYLRHILDAIALIAEYVTVGEERFLAETQPQDAVIRRLEIIGEATKRLSPDLRAQHPVVDWKLAAGMRDVLTHDDVGVELSKVWETARDDAPKLKR